MDLMHLGYWIAIALLAGLFFSILAANRQLRLGLKPISRSAWVGLLCIMILAGVLRFNFLPHQHNVFYDEFTHLDIASRAYTEHRFAVCSETHVEPEMNSCRYPKWGPGFGVLNSLWYKVAGEGRPQSFVFNRIVSLLSVALAFGFGFIILGSAGAGLWMAFLLAVYPLHLKFSGGTSLEPLSFFFLLLSSTLTVLFLRNPKCGKLFWAAVFSLVYCGLVRIENTLLAGPLLVVSAFNYYRSVQQQSVRLVGVAITALLALILIGHGLHALHSEEQFHSSGAPVYLLANLLFWIKSELHPLLFSLAALPGIWLLWKVRSKYAVALLVFGTVFWFLYSAIHRVDFNHLDFCRFALQLSIFFLAMAAVSFDRLARKDWKRIVPLVILVLGTVFYGFNGIRTSLRPTFSQEIGFLERTALNLPQSAIILSDIPVVHKIVQERTAIRREVFNNESELAKLIETGQPLYLYCGIVCNLRKHIAGDMEINIPGKWKQDTVAAATGGSVQLHMGKLEKVDFTLSRLYPK